MKNKKQQDHKNKKRGEVESQEGQSTKEERLPTLEEAIAQGLIGPGDRITRISFKGVVLYQAPDKVEEGE